MRSKKTQIRVTERNPHGHKMYIKKGSPSWETAMAMERPIHVSLSRLLEGLVGLVGLAAAVARMVLHTKPDVTIICLELKPRLRIRNLKKTYRLEVFW